MWTLAIAIALVGIAQVASAALRGGVGLWLSNPGAAHLRSDATFTLPAQIGPWQRGGETDKSAAQPEIAGRRYQTWAYQSAGLTAIVAIDYPFAGHNDLALRYRNAGWVIAQQAANPSRPDPRAGEFTIVQATRLHEWGYLCYASLDETGQWTQLPKASLAGQLQERLTHLGRPGANAATHQIQLWVQTLSPLDAASQEQLIQLFLGTRDLLAPQVIAQQEGRQ